MQLNRKITRKPKIARRPKIVDKLGLLAATAAVALAAPATAPATAAAAPQWLTPQTVSQTGYDAAQQQVAFDQNGDAIAVWQSWGGINPVIAAAARPAGGSFSAPQTLSDSSGYAMSPAVAADAQGDAVAVWVRSEGAEWRAQAAYRPAGGSFSAPQTLSPAGYEAREPHVAMNTAGQAIVVWTLDSPAGEKIQAASVAPGGTFSEAVDVSGFSNDNYESHAAIDAQGDALVVWTGWDGANTRIEESQRPTGGGFGTTQFLSPAGTNASEAQAAYDATGDALAVWTYRGSPVYTTQGSYRPAGGSFGTVQTISGAPLTTGTEEPQVAFDASGEGVVLWSQSNGSEPSVYTSVRTPGSAGTFSTPTTINPSGQETFDPRLAGDDQSGTVASWKTFNGIANTVQATVRPAGGSFAPATTLSGEAPEESAPAVGIDGQDNAIAVWSQSVGPNYLLQAAGYDAGPDPRGLQLPTQGVVGQPLQFAQAPLGVWNPVLSEGFAFGDSTSASGSSATHTYSAPGTYQVTVTATDVLGNTTTVTRTLTIVPAPAPAGSGASPAPIRCTLGAARRQRRLGSGSVAVSVICNTTLAARLAGHLTVSVPHATLRGRHHGVHVTLRSYLLGATALRLQAGHSIATSLSLPASTRRAIVIALHNHHQVGLYLSLSGSGTQVQAHVAGLLAPQLHTKHTTR
jgi:hypothetical protein